MAKKEVIIPIKSVKILDVLKKENEKILADIKVLEEKLSAKDQSIRYTFMTVKALGILNADLGKELQVKREYQKKIQEEYNAAMLGIEMLQEMNDEQEEECQSLYMQRNHWRFAAISLALICGSLVAYLAFN